MYGRRSAAARLEAGAGALGWTWSRRNTQIAERILRQLGDREVLRAVTNGVAEEARTRGFAAPALAGCALFEEWRQDRMRYQGCQ
jgi:hypothetical protein